jgi:hypothetical protein
VTHLVQVALLVIGAGWIITGVACLSIPAAFIVAGVCLSAFALLWDFPEKGGSA